MKGKLFKSFVIIAIWAACCCLAAGAQSTCSLPDNGRGTVDVPANCPLTSDGSQPIKIGDLRGEFIIDSFFDVFYEVGNEVEGGIVTFAAGVRLSLTNPCDETFLHVVSLPAHGQLFVGPRPVGADTQSFETEMVALQASLPPGDPHFNSLDLDLSPLTPHNGHVTVLKDPVTGDFTVDSFFDITYRIDFQGAPGGALDDMAGTAEADVRLTNGVHHGDSFFDVFCGNSMVRIGGPYIPPFPADFFGPGSDPFAGVANIGSSGMDGVIVRSLEELRFANTVPSTDTIPIEIVSMDLKSCEPITVTYADGAVQHWTLEVRVNRIDMARSDPGFLPDGTPLRGTLRATKTHDNGGTFDMQLAGRLQLVLTQEGDPTGRALTWDTEMISMSLSSSSWVIENPKKKAGEYCDGLDNDCDGFFAVNDPPLVLGGEELKLNLKAPEPVNPFFLLTSGQEWQEALADGRVGPTPPNGWENQNQLWQKYGVGRVPEVKQIMKPDLYVFEGDPTSKQYPHETCLIMAWGDQENIPPDVEMEATAGWSFAYPVDPDLSNSTISLTVHPPPAIVNVTFGLTDISGFQVSWSWANPTDIASSPPSTIITINTNDIATLGMNAPNPSASGYAITPGFDITKVVSFFVNETFHTTPGTFPALPPGAGSTTKLYWNAWDEFKVLPNPPGGGGGGGSVNSKWFTKWSQPPVEVEPGLINGWDEYSNYHKPPIMADDWQCADKRPVTDIHWWGSFIGWTQPCLPPQLPIGFHIGIWTDVPASPINTFSHPDRLIWQNYCDTWIWNFAGYDLDPRTDEPTWQENEACFQFAQFLSQDEWFHQEPMDDGTPNVYWLSISAIYPAGEEVQFPWGWKTRPHFFNDDAVRITSLQNGTWPPTIGSTWGSGKPVEYPQGVSWDLAFELTTNHPGEQDDTIPGDIDGPNGEPDGVVNLIDLSIIARNWLRGVLILN